MPNLEPVVDSLDKVPEAARPFYEQRDGKFHVALSAAPAGFVPAADLAAANGKVVEFRDNNIRLTQEVEQLRPIKTQFDGIDPVAAKDALAQVEGLKKKGVTKPEDLTVLIAAAVKEAVTPMQQEIATTKATAAADRARADEGTLRTVIGEKFTKAGGQPKATDFVMGLAKDVFRVENGVVKALPNKFSADRPGEPLGVEEWLTSVAKENDFAFAPSTGTGANPARGAGGGNLKPGQTVLRDPTPAQLGEYAKDISTGKVRIEYSK